MCVFINVLLILLSIIKTNFKPEFIIIFATNRHYTTTRYYFHNDEVLLSQRNPLAIRLRVFVSVRRHVLGVSARSRTSAVHAARALINRVRDSTSRSVKTNVCPSIRTSVRQYESVTNRSHRTGGLTPFQAM